MRKHTYVYKLADCYNNMDSETIEYHIMSKMLLHFGNFNQFARDYISESDMNIMNKYALSALDNFRKKDLTKEELFLINIITC